MTAQVVDKTPGHRAEQEPMETVAEYAHVKRAELETEVRQLRAAVYALREELELANVELKHSRRQVFWELNLMRLAYHCC